MNKIIELHQVRLSHAHQDALTDLNWLKESSKSFQVPEMAYPEIKQLDQLFSYKSWFYEVGQFFQHNPKENFCPIPGLTDSQFNGGMTREQFFFLVELNRDKRSKGQRNSELKEIMQLNQTVAILDGFLFDAVKVLYQTNPEALKRKDKTLTYEELMKAKDKGEIIELIINKELAKISFDSLKDQIKHIATTFAINFDILKGSVDEVAQIREVRHIHVHNKGLVDAKYIRKTRDTSLPVGYYKSLKDTYFQDRLYNVVESFLTIFYIEIANKLEKLK